jgi:hypothetical protein
MEISKEFMSLEQNIRSGSLCIFGSWFGRPMDNYHKSVQAEFSDSVLKVSFDEGETLEVWDPSGIEVESSILIISNASKVRWSWYYYGKPKTQENLRHREYFLNESNSEFKAVKIC